MEKPALECQESALNMDEPALECQLSALNMDKPALECQEDAFNIDNPELKCQEDALNTDKPALECKESVSNMATQTLEEDFWLSSTSAEDNEDCDICDVKQKAIKYCSQCKQYFCVKCLKVHAKITKVHKVTNCRNAKLENRKLALLSSYHTIDDTKILIGFNTQKKTSKPGVRFLLETKVKSDIAVNETITGHENSILSSIKGIKGAWNNHCPYYFSRDIYFAAGKQLTYFTSTFCKKVCKMDEGMRSASVAFKTPGQCYGITKFDNGLALVQKVDSNFLTTAWHIQCYSLDGRRKQQILYDQEGLPLFEQPEYLTTNTEENILFATDTKKNILYAVDTKGTILFKFHSEDMVSPKGLTTDNEENIYIACKGRILQLEQNGVKYRTVLRLKKEMENNCIENVYFDSETSQLAVIEDNQHGSVFQFLSD